MHKVSGKDRIILWEAHRGGGGYELPESTPVGFEYAWMLGGIPEADVNVTVDGQLLSLHDGTLKRTARNVDAAVATTPISQLTAATVRKYDIGSDRYPDQIIPSIQELLAKLHNDPDKQIIIDYKNAPLEQLSELISQYSVAKQVTLATTDEQIASKFKALQPDVQIKIWLGGTAEQIQTRFDLLAVENFKNFEQIQVHLNLLEASKVSWRYQLQAAQVQTMQEQTKAKNVLLQVLPWEFERDDIFAILDLGVRSFAVDYPNKFCLLCAEYFAGKWSKPGN